VPLAELQQKRKEVLFLLGSNRSINDIDPKTWGRIGLYDTFGFNYWIYHGFIPTYYALEYDTNPIINVHHAQLLQNRRKDYAETVFIVNTRARRRGMVARMMPEFFAFNPKVHYLLVPKPVACPDSRPFCREDFKEHIFYRGSLNFYLHLARQIGYRKIVLVGCEMDTSTCFYEDWPEAQWMFEMDGYLPDKQTRAVIRYGGTYATKGKHDFITTIHAINDLVFKAEGIELYVFNRKSLLYPKIPLFSWDTVG